MLEKLNRRLKEDGVRVRIQAIGSSLYLRATLPDRATQQLKQQRIRLSTQDLQEADEESRLLGELMKEPHDLWWKWDTRFTEPSTYTVGDFRKAARNLYETKFDTEDSWKRKWGPALNKLPSDSLTLSVDLLVTVVEQLPARTAGRRDQGNILSQVANYLKLDGEAVQSVARGYTSKDLKERDIPTDDVIEELFYKIKLPHWRWMYGMTACYGIRPHEIVECQFDDEYNLEISENTKTGFRVAWPCHERWLHTFNLQDMRRPTQNKRNVGHSANQYLHERGLLPWALYNLRHAYAVRLFHKGVPSNVAAELMGHSEQVHRQDYKRWYDRRKITTLRSQYKT
jgi:hypothetical protein